MKTLFILMIAGILSQNLLLADSEADQKRDEEERIDDKLLEETTDQLKEAGRTLTDVQQRTSEVPQNTDAVPPPESPPQENN